MDGLTFFFACISAVLYAFVVWAWYQLQRAEALLEKTSFVMTDVNAGLGDDFAALLIKSKQDAVNEEAAKTDEAASSKGRLYHFPH